MFGRASLGEAILDLGADHASLERDMRKAERGARGIFQNIQSSATRILEFATGGLLVRGIESIVSGFQRIGSSALQAVGDAQRLEMGLRGLLTESLMYEQVTQQQTRQIQLNADEQRSLERLTLEREVAAAELAEYQQKLSEADEVTAEHRLKLMEMQDDVAALAGEYEALAGRQGQYVTSTTRSWQQVRTFTEAQELARQKTAELLAFIEQLAIASPFETKQVEEVARLGVAAGLTTDEVQAFTQAFLDYSAVHGIASSNLAFAADQFLQLRKIGKLTTVDLRQLRRLGIDVERILGVKMGMSVEEFNSKVEHTPELMDQLFESFTEMASEGAAGAAQEMATTMDGMMSTMTDIVEVGSRKLFRPLVEAASPYAAEIVGKLGDFVTGPQMEAIGAKAGRALGSGLRGIVSLLSGGDTRGAFVDLGQAVTELFGAEAGMKVVGLRDDFESLVETVTNVWDTLQGVASGEIDWKTLLPEELQGLASTLSEALPGVLEGVERFFNFFTETGPTAGQNAKEVFGTISGILLELGSNEILPWLMGQFDKISAWFTENTPLITANANEWKDAIVNISMIVGGVLKTVWYPLSGVLGGIIDLALGVAEAFMHFSQGNWEEGFAALGEGAQKAWQSVKEGFGKLADWVLSWFGTDWETVKGTWSQNWEMFQEIVDAIWQQVQEKWDAFVETVLEKAGEVKTFFTETLPGAIDEAKAAIEGKIEDLKQVGRDLLGGLKAGIEEKKEELKQLLQGVANVIPQWLKGWLGIGSPSRVMIPLGFAVPEGLGTGIEKGLDWLKHHTLPKFERELDLVPTISGAMPTMSLAGAMAAPAGAASGDVFRFNFGDVTIQSDDDIETLAKKVVREIQRHRR